MSSATASDATLSDVEPPSEWRQGGLTPRQRLLVEARKTARERYWDVYDRDSRIRSEVQRGADHCLQCRGDGR